MSRILPPDKALTCGVAERILAWFGNNAQKSQELWEFLQEEQQPMASTSDGCYQPLADFPLLLALALGPRLLGAVQQPKVHLTPEAQERGFRHVFVEGGPPVALSQDGLSIQTAAGHTPRKQTSACAQTSQWRPTAPRGPAVTPCGR